MSTDDLKEFEASMHEQIDAFLDAEAKPGKASQQSDKPSAKRPPKASAREMKTGHIVKLAVRTKQLELDSAFEYHSTSISKLEAQMEAEKAAREAGYPIIGYVIDIQRV